MQVKANESLPDLCNTVTALVELSVEPAASAILPQVMTRTKLPMALQARVIRLWLWAIGEAIRGFCMSQSVFFCVGARRGNSSPHLDDNLLIFMNSPIMNVPTPPAHHSHGTNHPSTSTVAGKRLSPKLPLFPGAGSCVGGDAGDD